MAVCPIEKLTELQEEFDKNAQWLADLDKLPLAKVIFGVDAALRRGV